MGALKKGMEMLNKDMLKSMEKYGTKSGILLDE